MTNEVEMSKTPARKTSSVKKGWSKIKLTTKSITRVLRRKSKTKPQAQDTFLDHAKKPDPRRPPAHVPADSPVIRPASDRKSGTYTTDPFRELDKRAIRFARRCFYDLEKMTLRLTRVCQSDTEKARVLFRWVVAKDLISRNAKKLNWTVSTVGDVTDLQTNRELIHRLYQAVCRFAGLRCEVISGYSKGAGYKPGMRIRGDSFRNCWTAVAIDDKWQLVNCTWAASQRTTGKLSSTCDEFYFLTEPQEHIFQHYPDDPKWQLLENPLPFEDFTKLPFVKSAFFRNCLRFSSTYSCSIKSCNGKAEIRLRIPENVILGSRLKQATRSPRNQGPDVGVGVRVINNQAVVTVLSRDPGRYYLSLYAASGDDAGSLESACTFLVKFSETKSTAL